MTNGIQKGKQGEREIADALNFVAYKAMQAAKYPNPTMQSIQRNKQQAAVGGADLIGTLDFSIEVKRQEQLAIETWWNQCVAGAERNNRTPVLIYRQNGKKWKCILYLRYPLDGHDPIRAEISFDYFLAIFQREYYNALLRGYQVTI